MPEYLIVPVPKPRMTRRDKWLNPPRKAVAKYRAFCDEVRLHKVTLSEAGWHVIFIIPMSKSWSKAKKDLMNGRPHQQKPDKDNLEKALLDAIFEDDCRIWDGRVSKIWGREGKIIIYEGASS